MRAVVQRVSEASVRVGDEMVGRIGRGILVLVGVARGDGEREADYLIDKIVHLRIFEDDAGKLNRSVLEVGGEALVVSQFTLLGDCRRRPVRSTGTGSTSTSSRGFAGRASRSRPGASARSCRCRWSTTAPSRS